MNAGRSQEKFKFQALGGKKVEVDFSGGYLSSDGGTLLLRELDQRLKLSQGLSECFVDERNADCVEHPLAVLIA